jgi:hypothetical protein
LGCKKTPLRNSYYCENHIKYKTKFAFKYKNGTVYIDLEDIVVRKGKIKKNELIIYDAHVDQYDNLLLLVDYGEKEVDSYFWITSKQIEASKIEKYTEQMKKVLHLSTIDGLSCNSTKIFTLPCNKKSRTVGIWLGCYSCGLIGSYKVRSGIFFRSIYKISLEISI